MAAGFPGGVGAAGVVAGAQVVDAGGPAGQQVPDDDQDGAGDRDQGPEFAPAADDPPVALAGECAGAGGRGGGFAEDGLEAGVSLAGPPGAVLRPGLDGAGAECDERRGRYPPIRPRE